MDSLQYVEQVNAAQQRPFRGLEVDIVRLLSAFIRAIEAGKILNKHETILFSNSKFDVSKIESNNCSNLPYQFEGYENGVSKIYAILKLHKEATYLLETLVYAFKNKDIVPNSDIKNSCANIFESLALLSNSIDCSFEEMQITSIENLKIENKIPSSVPNPQYTEIEFL